MKNILITGISKGLGLKLTQFFLHRTDCNIYGISRNYTEELQALKRDYPDRLKWKASDLNNFESLEKEIFEDLIGPDTPLFALINNAGVHYVNLLPRMKDEKILEQINLNLIAPILLSKLAIKNFLRFKTKGHLIHISSVSAHVGSEGLTAYSASKGGIEAFSGNVAKEFGKRGIRSNVLVLGLLKIGMGVTVPKNIATAFQESSALKKYTDYNDVMEMINFLLSDKSNSITGHNIHIDSGTL